MRLLVVDARSGQGPALTNTLMRAGYAVTNVAATPRVFDALSEGAYQAVVLDLGLPDGDGIDLLRSWRRHGFTEPVIILSSRNTVADRVNGLDCGADDFLAKPYSRDELLARLRSLLRRQAQVKSAVLEHRDIRVDVAGKTAQFRGDRITLSPYEFALLEIFMQNPGRIVTRSSIYEAVWPSRGDVEPNLLDVYMYKLRSKFHETIGGPVFQTVRGLGYKLI